MGWFTDGCSGVTSGFFESGGFGGGAGGGSEGGYICHVGGDANLANRCLYEAEDYLNGSGSLSSSWGYEECPLCAVVGGAAIRVGARAAVAAIVLQRAAQAASPLWSRATFPSAAQSIIYHWRTHAQQFGISIPQYTSDARMFFQAHSAQGLAYTFKDGTTGIVIRTQLGPGGLFTTDGRIVSFWYMKGQ